MAKAPSKPAKAPVASSAIAPSKDMSVNIRKISNGYLVTKSGYKGDKYVSTEVFMKTVPKLS